LWSLSLSKGKEDILPLRRPLRLAKSRRREAFVLFPSTGSGTGESTCFHTQGPDKVLVFILRDWRKYLFSYSGTGESTCFHTQGREKVFVFILRDERKYLFSYSGTGESTCFHTQGLEKVLVFILRDERKYLFSY